MEQHHPSRVSAVPRQALPREERHPNSVTAPPVRRGSMAPRPWRGFWNSVLTAMLSGAMRLLPGGARGAQVAEPREAWQAAADRRLFTFAILTLLSTAVATWLFALAQPDYVYVHAWQLASCAHAA